MQTTALESIRNQRNSNFFLGDDVANRLEFKDWHKDNLVFLLEVAKRYYPKELEKILQTYTDIRKGD